MIVRYQFSDAWSGEKMLATVDVKFDLMPFYLGATPYPEGCTVETTYTEATALIRSIQAKRRAA